MSSYLVGAKLVDGQGRLKEFTASDPEIAALRLHLGLCGLVYEMTLRVSSIRRSGGQLWC